MKKLIISSVLIFLFTSLTIDAFSKPIYVGLRLGFRAHWEIVIGNCQDGNGLCLSIPLPEMDNAALGYDANQPGVFFIKVAKTESIAKYFSNGKYELLEDSPIDPALITKFTAFKNQTNKFVILKKGVYQIKTEEDNYVVAINYYLQ